MAGKSVETFVVKNVMGVNETNNIVIVDEEGNTLLIQVVDSDEFARVAMSKSISYSQLLE